MIRYTEPLRLVSLFSGIGGFELGFSRAGHQTVLMCENNELARSVLSERFPNVPIEDDITTISNLPDCDIVTAGWPCQDLSLAGTMKGLNGSRSGLISEVFRLIRTADHKPSYILLENVAFALDLKGGEAVTYAIRELEHLGYRWAYRILDSINFGLPQRRRRIFILGALDDDPAEVLLDGIDIPPPPIDPYPDLIGFYWTEGNRGIGWTPNAIPPLKGGSGVSIPSPPGIWSRSSSTFVSPTLQDAERLQGFDPDWTLPAQPNTANGRRRWLLVGNAVSVPVVEWIARRLSRHRSRQRHFSDVSNGLRLARAATGGPGVPTKAFEARFEGPREYAIMPLGRFGLIEPVPLTLRAVAGFTKRFEAAPLRKNAEFLNDLRLYIRDRAVA